MFTFNGYRVSVWEDEKGLEMDHGDGCITMLIYLMLRNCTPKMAEMVNFVLCTIYHNKNDNNN